MTKLGNLFSVLALGLTMCTAMSLTAQTPGYINHEANHIDLNGADWSELRSKAAATPERTLRVLHIGDSHIQAEFVTNELRRLLQLRYGNAGRGLVSPLRLAGTNQPVDYTIESAVGDEGRMRTRLLKHPWPLAPGVTGVAEALPDFDRLVIRATGPGHGIKNATILTASGTSQISLDELADSVEVYLEPYEAFYGAILENGRPGLLYSAIGNNGACFVDYNMIHHFAADTRVFAPDLIVLSMGTNEGFSGMTDKQIAQSVSDMVNMLHVYNPSAKMLILTPMECQRNRNHGRKPLSEYYDINDRVAQARDIILDVARRERVPVWDFYEVAGGHGASERWIADGLMNPRDHIHLLKSGYELQAQLLYEALTEALDKK